MAAVGLAGCPIFPYSGSSTPRSGSGFPDRYEIIVHQTDRAPSEDIKARHAGQRLEGEYAITTDASGRVTAVRVLRSIPDCDDFVAANLRQWQLNMRGGLTMRIAVVFAAPLPSGQYRGLPELEFNSMIISRVAPAPGPGRSGAGSYMVYVEPDGRVSRVDVIQSTGNANDVARATLAQWRFDPPLERIRGVVRMIVELKP